jgi:ketosteroid isomerase-like protein
MVRRPLVLVAPFLVNLIACTQPPAPPDLEAARASLGDTAARYAKTATAKEAAGFAAFYASDAVVYAPNEATVKGSAAIGEFIKPYFGDANFAVTFQPAVVEVSADGSMGTTLAITELTATGPDGKPASERVRDFHVWRRQPDGSWKLTVDIWNAEPAAAAASTPSK